MPVLHNRFRLSSGATYSLNINQQSQIDLNFSRKALFTLPLEARPVFVNSASIFPATGSILSRDARISQAYAQVTDYLSDLRSHSTQLSFGVSPIAFNSALTWNATYVWQRVVDQTRGFGGGTTASDPYLTQWARGDRDARHQITYNIGYTFHQAVSVTAFGRVQSGNPFTPMTAGDVNGDGYNNDRAFIYNPASTADPVLSASMANLLSNAPPSVRDCLRRQLGTIAGKNSCQSPWSTSLSLRVGLVSQGTQDSGSRDGLARYRESAHRYRRVGPRLEQPSRLGRAIVHRSEPALRARLRSGNAALHVRRESAVRRESSRQARSISRRCSSHSTCGSTLVRSASVRICFCGCARGAPAEATR
jgi:hypothetical protein